MRPAVVLDDSVDANSPSFPRLCPETTSAATCRVPGNYRLCLLEIFISVKAVLGAVLLPIMIKLISIWSIFTSNILLFLRKYVYYKVNVMIHQHRVLVL